MAADGDPMESDDGTSGGPDEKTTHRAQFPDTEDANLLPYSADWSDWASGSDHGSNEQPLDRGVTRRNPQEPHSANQDWSRYIVQLGLNLVLPEVIAILRVQFPWIADIRDFDVAVSFASKTRTCTVIVTAKSMIMVKYPTWHQDPFE